MKTIDIRKLCVIHGSTTCCRAVLALSLVACGGQGGDSSLPELEGWDRYEMSLASTEGDMEAEVTPAWVRPVQIYCTDELGEADGIWYLVGSAHWYRDGDATYVGFSAAGEHDSCVAYVAR